MAFAKFKLGTSTEYTQSSAQYSEYIYACEDTRDVYIFGVKQPGFTDEQFEDLANINQTILEVINSQKNIANGIAGLDEEGKIPVSLLNGQFAHVQGIDKVATSSTLPDTTSLAAEYMVWCTDDKKLREWSGAEWDVIDPTGDTIYNFRNSDATGDTGRTNIIYRWDGSTMVEISASLALGETAGTAYEGSKGKALADAAATNPNTLVTGFGAVTPNATQITIAFTDADKNTGNNKYTAGDGGTVILPAATNSAAGLMSAADKAALDSLTGSGEGSLEDLVNKVGDPANLTTEAKDNLVNAINELETNINNLDAATVKQVKVGTSEAMNPIAGLITIANATTFDDGAMAKEDKAKLNSLPEVFIIDYQTRYSLSQLKEAVTTYKTIYYQDSVKGLIPVIGVSTEEGGTPDTNYVIIQIADKDQIQIKKIGIVEGGFPQQSEDVASLQFNGDGTKFLANNGTYKEVPLQLSDDYAASDLVNEALAPAGGDSFETAIGKLHKAILDNEEVTTGALVNFQTVLGTQNPNQVLPDLSSTNYLQSASTFVACLQALDAALKTVADQAAKITDLEQRVVALETALTLQTV